MFVVPEFRRQGLGEALLSHAVSELTKRSVKSVSLKVDSDNTAAVALYRKRGFVVKGRTNTQTIFVKALET